VKVAEVGVKIAELQTGRVEKLASTNAVSKEELEKARLELDAAKAQLEIRLAEMREVEVRIKHAKKRLDDAKAGPPGGRTQPNPAPKAVDPPAPTTAPALATGKGAES
jgi:hypothetical protein